MPTTIETTIHCESVTRRRNEREGAPPPPGCPDACEAVMECCIDVSSSGKVVIVRLHERFCCHPEPVPAKRGLKLLLLSWRGTRRHGWCAAPKRRVAVAVQEVQHQADSEPPPKSFPGKSRQPAHHKEA